MSGILQAALELTAEDISALPDRELFVLVDVVEDATGLTVAKDSDRERAIEAQMAKELDEDYVADLIAASGPALAGLPAEDVSMDEVHLAMQRIGTEMDARDTSRALKILTTGVTALALISRRTQKAHISGKDPRAGASITASFSQADKDALGVMAESQLWWVGDLWSKNLSSVITATVARESLTTGLGREQVGGIMRGIVNGTVPGAAVPGTWRGSTEQYFEMLSGTVRTRASAFGSVSSMRDAGFEWYRIVAVMDERTSERCRLMNGKRFKVSDGERLVNRALSARDPDEYKAVAGWRTAKEIEMIAGDGDEESQRMALSSAGLALPPYHGRCRTIVLAE